MAYQVVILGAGISGIGAALLAKKKNISVFVSDSSKIDDEKKMILEQNNIPYEEKQHSRTIILNAKKIVKSPGIPENIPILQEAEKRNIQIISEIEFAYNFSDAKIIAITGSNGKTTTTSLIYHLLKTAQLDVAVGGNIGKSFAQILATERDYEFFVLEISSFQLDRIEKFKPDIAIITNITPDHLDRYDYKFDNYIKSKFRIAQNQTKEDFLILNRDDQVIHNYLQNKKLKPRILYFSLREINSSAFFLSQKNKIKVYDFSFDINNFHLKGKHNIYNAMASVLVLKILGIENQYIIKGLQTFKPIKHRLEPVSVINNVLFVNDSKATNVDSLWYALDSFDKKIILILGGIDKGNDYSKVKNLVKQKVKHIIALGKDNRAIVEFFSSLVPISQTQSIIEAVRKAYKIANPNDVVLLSPACASFDLFKNYIDRGEQFIAAVENLKKTL